MDLDTIIYIIITVVIFIVSLVGNRKPKQLPPQEESDDIAYTLNEFEKILERKEEFAQMQASNTGNVEVVQEEQHSELAEYYEKEEEKKKQENIIQKKEDINHKEEIKKENKHDEDEDTDDGFDLNAAIIYSSILERKKFRH